MFFSFFCPISFNKISPGEIDKTLHVEPASLAFLRDIGYTHSEYFPRTSIGGGGSARMSESLRLVTPGINQTMLFGTHFNISSKVYTGNRSEGRQVLDITPEPLYAHMLPELNRASRLRLGDEGVFWRLQWLLSTSPNHFQAADRVIKARKAQLQDGGLLEKLGGKRCLGFLNLWAHVCSVVAVVLFVLCFTVSFLPRNCIGKHLAMKASVTPTMLHFELLPDLTRVPIPTQQLVLKSKSRIHLLDLQRAMRHLWALGIEPHVFWESNQCS